MESERKKDLENLLRKFVENSCSNEEKHQFYELLSSSDGERSIKEILFSHLSEFNDDSNNKYAIDSEHLYNKILSEINHFEIIESENKFLKRRTRTRQLFIQVLSMAALFCIAFFFGSIFKQRNAGILPKTVIEVTYNEIRAPLGARSEVKLADGSQVMLNAGSTLKYNNNYNSGNRDLILEGEAYFKIAKNTDLPLIVNAGKINIKATGTEFNIKAYPDEKIVETTLIEGKVEITQNTENRKTSILFLKPNQKAIYFTDADRLTLDKIKETEPQAVKPAKVSMNQILISPKADVEQVTAWIRNKMIIKSETLDNLCVKLQRKYNVTFVFGNDDIKRIRFSGTLLDETLEQVMNVIKLTSPVEYFLDGKTVLILPNKELEQRYSKHLKKNSN